MKPTIVFAACLVLAGCNPSKLFGPKSAEDELLGGNDAAVSGFPSGCWEDGLGNIWEVTVTGNTLAGTASYGELLGLTMTGKIDNEVLAYDVSSDGNARMASGTAQLTDSQHASFETVDTEGWVIGHGQFHFNHSIQAAAREPEVLKPITDCATPALQGD